MISRKTSEMWLTFAASISIYGCFPGHDAMLYALGFIGGRMSNNDSGARFFAVSPKSRKHSAAVRLGLTQ